MTAKEKNDFIAQALNTSSGRTKLAEAMTAPIRNPRLFPPTMACPRCGSFDIAEAGKFRCNSCGQEGPQGQTVMEGRAVWNRAGKYYGWLVIEEEHPA